MHRVGSLPWPKRRCCPAASISLLQFYISSFNGLSRTYHAVSSTTRPRVPACPAARGTSLSTRAGMQVAHLHADRGRETRASLFEDASDNLTASEFKALVSLPPSTSFQSTKRKSNRGSQTKRLRGRFDSNPSGKSLAGLSTDASDRLTASEFMALVSLPSTSSQSTKPKSNQGLKTKRLREPFPSTSSGRYRWSRTISERTRHAVTVHPESKTVVPPSSLQNGYLRRYRTCHRTCYRCRETFETIREKKKHVATAHPEVERRRKENRLATARHDIGLSSPAEPVPSFVPADSVVSLSKRPVKESIARRTASPSDEATGLHYRGNKYWELSAEEQHQLKQLLPATCHSRNELWSAKYTFPDSPSGYLAKPERVEEDVLRTFMRLPDRNPVAPKKAAILLDCEFDGDRRTQSTSLTQIHIIDFFSGATLYDAIIRSPHSSKEKYWRSREPLNAARASSHLMGQEVLGDWKAAREAVLQFADSETVIMGHALSNDLRLLRLHHPLIVDTTVLTNLISLKSGPMGLYAPWTLDALCTGLLGRNIRNTEVRCGRGRSRRIMHDAKEDTLATREIILTCMLRPEHFKSWAREARAERWRITERAIQRANEAEDLTQLVFQSMLQERLLEELCTWDGWTRPDAGGISLSLQDARSEYGVPRSDEDFGCEQVFPSTDAWEDPMVYDRVL